jgi:hypothetical protein
MYREWERDLASSKGRAFWLTHVQFLEARPELLTNFDKDPGLALLSDL